MIKALIFDFDGTVIDTETPWYKAFSGAYREQNAELTLDMYASCIGSGYDAFNPYEQLMNRMKLPIYLDAFRDSIRNRHASLMEQEDIRPGVLNYLKAAKTRGLRLGLVSSSFKRSMLPQLLKLGIAGYFDVICTADDITRANPEPDLYQHALSRLGVKAEEAIAFEDSPNGLKAARAAGLYTVLIPNALSEQLEFEPANYRVESLDELDLRQLLDNPSGLFLQSGEGTGRNQRQRASAPVQGGGPTFRLSIKKGSRGGSLRKENVLGFWDHSSGWYRSSR